MPMTLTVDRHRQVEALPIAFKNKVLRSQLTARLHLHSPELVAAVWNHQRNCMQIEYDLIANL